MTEEFARRPAQQLVDWHGSYKKIEIVDGEATAEVMGVCWRREGTRMSFACSTGAPLIIQRRMLSSKCKCRPLEATATPEPDVGYFITDYHF
jgi:hypothetical protein